MKLEDPGMGVRADEKDSQAGGVKKGRSRWHVGTLSATVRSITRSAISKYRKYITFNKQILRLLFYKLGTIRRQQSYNPVMPTTQTQLGRRLARIVPYIEVCAVLQ